MVIVLWFEGPSHPGAKLDAARSMVLTALPFLTWDLLNLFWLRNTILRQSRTKVRAGFHLFAGFAPVGPIVHERIRSALSDTDRSAMNTLPAAAVRSETQVRTWLATRSELLRSTVPDNSAPVLGQSVGASYDQAAEVTALRLSGTDSSTLPLILRAAIRLDGMAEVVCMLDGIAVVLPAPSEAPHAPAAPGGWRRSRRGRWHAALHWFEEPRLGLITALDALPRDAAADWLLARYIVALERPSRRTAALQAMGPARAAKALKVHPVHSDECGQLFRFGDPRASSMFVTVKDRVLDANGAGLEHWISVPPHTATAREAVAWTFLDERTSLSAGARNMTPKRCGFIGLRCNFWASGGNPHGSNSLVFPARPSDGCLAHRQLLLVCPRMALPLLRFRL
jgi:hypothetical protein